MSDKTNRDMSIISKIQENCDSILHRLERYEIDETVFLSNIDYREMILFPLIQIGELANHLSSDFVVLHGDVPWMEIIGMRHIVVHGYGTIDPKWTWNTIKNDIPVLKDCCRSILGNA